MVYKFTLKLVVWFVIAITRFRFPVDQSIPTIVRQRYNVSTVQALRTFEKIDRKLRKAELDLSFLDKCDELGLIPKFLLFKVANRHLRNSKTYLNCCRKLLKEEREHKRSLIRCHRRSLLSIKDELQHTLNLIDYSHILSCILKINDKYIEKHKEVQDKKLHKLLERSKAFCNDPKKVIHNFSSYKLSKAEEDILVRGLNFSIIPSKLNYADYCINFEMLFRSVRVDENLNTGIRDFLKTRIKDIALSSFKEFNDSRGRDSNLSIEEHECLKNLAAKKDLVIQKSDKGNSIVILNKSDYIDRVKDILSDTTKFQKAPIKTGKEIRHILNQEKKFKLVLNNLIAKGKISNKELNLLTPVGSRPGILYGLSKVHKPLVRGLPKVRPILSAIGTAAYNVAKFLVPILTPIANGPYSITNSFLFNKEILEQNTTLIMGSLDVDALFTSIPLDETINIGVEELFKDKAVINKLEKKDVLKLLTLATKESLFLFDGEYYYQTDGVAMGSPLGPTLANLFMSHYEQIWLRECPLEFKPKFYRRYVDDIFILVEKIEHLEKFKEYLNSKHKNIHFTSEIETEGKLPFLDVLIDRNGEKIVTSVYRKPTFTGVYTHYHSFLPNVYKFGLLSTLLFRYYSICSSYLLFNSEVLEFKKIFLRNGYPSDFIDACIKKFLDKIFTKKVKPCTVPKMEYFIVLPYLGPLSNRIQKRIKTVFQKVLPWAKINLTFKTQSRVSHLFRFKDLIPKDLVSNIIYSYTCQSCNARYIGETDRHSKVRWGEHLSISCFTDEPVQGIRTAVKDHMEKNKCKPDFDDFKVIGCDNNRLLRVLKESLFIKLYNPDLNKQVKSARLYLF